MTLRKRCLWLLALAAVLGALGTAWAVWNGYILLNDPKDYPVRGVDVSSYQGAIDWEALGRQGIAFAFIKATEGTTLTDRCYQANAAGARAAGMPFGAYHFFTTTSPGRTQAENFIATIGADPGELPPVIDLEVQGEQVAEELAIMVAALEDAYGTAPILYVTGETYRLYVEGRYPDCPVWIRSVYRAPAVAWTFWQYANRGRLEGYEGSEPFIDLNVFNGTAAEFSAFIGQRCPTPQTA